jgi:hypothetical protein
LIAITRPATPRVMTHATYRNCLEYRRAGEGIRTLDVNLGKSTCRRFGKKFDSLGSLLERLLEDISQTHGDPVEHYVTALCAKQLVRDVVRTFPEYGASHRDEVAALQTSIDRAEGVRQVLAEANPELPDFLEWFERWFLTRAKAVTTEEAT